MSKYTSHNATVDVSIFYEHYLIDVFTLCIFSLFICIAHHRFFAVAVWILVSAVSAFILNFLTQFYTIVIAFITFASSSLCAAIVSAISVSLYPTNIRAMATCFIFMFGRIGGLAGGNLIGALVEHHCNSIFNVYGILSIGELRFLNILKVSGCQVPCFVTKWNLVYT